MMRSDTVRYTDQGWIRDEPVKLRRVPGPGRRLSGSERKHYACIRRGGRLLVIDLVKLRLMNLRRRIFAWSRVVEPITRQPGVKQVMYRLSYDTAGTLVAASEWTAGDIRKFIMRLRARMGKRLLAYAWVAELQLRGVMHYHVCIVYRGYAPMPDRGYNNKDARGHRRSFGRMWEKGSSHTDFDVRSPYYMASYCKKEYQKDYMHFPLGAHAWAVWVSDEAMKAQLRWESLDDYKKYYLAHLMNDGGFGYEEAWGEWEREAGREKLAHRLAGDEAWEYCGSVVTVAGLAQWGLDVQEGSLTKVMNVFDIETSERPMTADENAGQ